MICLSCEKEIAAKQVIDESLTVCRDCNMKWALGMNPPDKTVALNKANAEYDQWRRETPVTRKENPDTFRSDPNYDPVCFRNSLYPNGKANCSLCAAKRESKGSFERARRIFLRRDK